MLHVTFLILTLTVKNNTGNNITNLTLLLLFTLLTESRMSSLPADYAFSLLVSVAGSALVDGPLYPVNKTGKSTSSSSSSSTSTSAKKQKKCKPPTKAQSSKGSTFTENFQGSQVVYRRPSVYFSIVKSSRKFPGYFNAAQKLIIVSWYVVCFINII